MYFFDLIIYKVSREWEILNENIKDWWIKTFSKRETDQGYTVIETTSNDRYLSYDELWDL
jgi:hypothetical protein